MLSSFSLVDDNIVPLSPIEGEEGSDYINASYVNVSISLVLVYIDIYITQGYKRKNAYIATQGQL